VTIERSQGNGGPSRHGRWALVAGGSEGIGAAFARALAARGHDVLLVAEKAEPLEAFAASLAREHGVVVEPLVADLARTEGLAQVVQAGLAREVGVLVCNAALAPLGPFVEVSIEDALRALDLNCRAPLVLARRLAPPMIARGRGAIVLMSSMAGRQGSALFSTYAATKAFDLVLAEALWDELRGSGVEVLGVCAGATRTPGWTRAGGTPVRLAPPVMEADAVVAEALAALGHTPSIVAGRWNRLATGFMERLLPRKAVVEILGRSTRATFRREGT
jgi:short-subunit dehydrogenase